MTKEEVEKLLELPDHLDESGEYYRGDAVRRIIAVAYNKALEDARAEILSWRDLDEIDSYIEDLKIK